MLNEQLNRLAKRLLREMLNVSKQQVDLKLFIGLGLALAFVYEEATGQSAANLKPKEVMQWAEELPLIKLEVN